MATYRYLILQDDKIEAWIWAEQYDDNEAVGVARRLGKGRTTEIWTKDRLVSRVGPAQWR